MPATLRGSTHQRRSSAAGTGLDALPPRLACPAPQGPYSWFVSVTVVCGVAAMSIFAGVVYYAKRKRLL